MAEAEPSAASKRKQQSVKEEERFSCVYDALPSHLRQAEVPEPLKNLSTSENERLARFFEAAEGRPPSDLLANMYFVDEMRKVIKNDSAEFLGHQLVRLSKDRRYGYVAGAPVSAKLSTFMLFTLASAGDGRVFYGRYTSIDVPLAPLTNDEHQFRSIPITIRERFPDGKIPCTAIAFHSFDEHLRLTIQEATSSPKHPIASNPTQPLPSSSQSRSPSPEFSKDVSTRAIQDVKDGQAEIRSEAKIPTDRREDSRQHQVNLNPDNSTALGNDSEHQFGPSQEENEDTSKRPDALLHSQRLPSQSPPAHDVEGPMVGDEVNRRTTARALTGQVEDVSGRHVNFDPDSFVVVRQGPDDYHGARQEPTEETSEQAEALRHSRGALDPADDSENDKTHMNGNVPASSSSTTAKQLSSAPVPSQERSKGVSAASRSRKWKERAQEPEETPSGPANVATDLIEARLRVEYDSSYASRIAMNEARQTGISQEQLESMVKFDESSNGAEKVGGEEGSVGNFGNDQGNQPNSDTSNASDCEGRASRLLPYVASPEQGSRPAFAQCQVPTTDGRRSVDNPQSSPPSREPSPARTDITYDDGVQDDGQDMGGTSGGQDPEQSGPATPGPTKRKRTVTPSTGSEERPATKHRRPGSDAEDEPSPLPQSRVRNSRRDLISTPRQPLRRWNTDPSLRSDPTLEARSMVDGISLRGLRPSDSIPEEEATEVAGRNSLAMPTLNPSAGSIATDRAGDTEDDGRETEPQFDQMPIRVIIETPRFLVERPQDARESTLWPAATARTTNDTQASPSAEDPSQQAPTNVLPDGMCVIKATYHVRLINDGSAAAEPQPTSSSAPPASSRAEPSTSATATPNRNLRTQLHVDSASQTDRPSTSDSRGSSRPVIAHVNAPELLGLLRAWRAAFINLDDELLAEAGLRSTEEAPNPQTHEEERYHILLLSLLENFRGYWSSFAVKNAAKIAAPARWIRFGSPGGELERHSTTVPLTDPGILKKSGARPPLGASDPDTTNLGQVLALLTDSLNRLSSAATVSTRPNEQGLNDLASAPGTSNPTHVNQALGSGREDHGTDIAGTETEHSAENQSNARSSNQPAATNARNESDTAEVKTKQKDTKNKSKKGKNTEKLDPGPVRPGPSRSTTSENLGDIEMTILEVQPPPHTSDPPANNPALPQTAETSGSLQPRPPSPMDTEWDDNKSEAERSGGKNGEKQDSAPNDRDNEPLSNRSIPEQEHLEESSSAQPTTMPPSSKEKKPKKKKDSRKPGTTGSSVPPAVRPGEASPTVEAPPEPCPAVPTPRETPEDSPPPRVGTQIGQISSTPPTALPPSSQDENMVDIESPKRLPERDVNHGAQIPAQQTVGEGPIVPDDEGPPPSSARLDASITRNNDVRDPNNPTSNIESAETAVENVPSNTADDSWSDSDFTEEYEEARANPYRLRDVLHAAAAQDIMDQLLPGSSHPSPQPSPDTVSTLRRSLRPGVDSLLWTSSIEANSGPTPTEHVDPLDGTPIPSRTTTPTAPRTTSAVVEQAIPGTSVPPEQSVPAGASGSNEISAYGGEGPHDQGSSLPGSDALVQGLVNRFGPWSLFYEPTASGTSRTN
ncbi:hypothetical protein FRC00_013952, partial [Tulasnella sp. 408]